MAPNCRQKARNDSWVHEGGRARTKSLSVLAVSDRGMARFGSIYGREIASASPTRAYRVHLSQRETHVLAVEVVLARHDGVDRARLFEGQERKAAGAATLGVAHDGAVRDLAKLLKVHLQRVCECVRGSVRSSRGERANISGSLPSVVSQFSPPMNIFLYSAIQA